MLPLYSLPGFNNGKIFLFLSFFPTGSCSVSPAALLFVPKVRHQPWVFSLHSTNLSWWSVSHTDISCRWLLRPLPCISQTQPSAGFGSSTPFSQPLDSLLSCALFLSCITGWAWSISRGLASMYNSTSWQRDQEDSLCAPKWMEIQLKVTAFQRQTHYKHSFQLGWFMDSYFPIASSISNYFSECHHLMMNLRGLRDVESLQDSRSVQISCIFQVNSLARSYMTTFQCKPHAFSLKKNNFTMYEWTKRKFVKKVQL